MESYTFPYVPYNPLDILMNCHTFVHVPYTFVHIPCNSSTKSVKWDKALQLPQGLSSCAWIPTPVLMWPSCFRSYTFRYTFLYVPDAPGYMWRASRPWQPIEAAAQLESLRPGSLSPASVHGLCAFLYVPLYVPIRSGRPPHISVYVVT